MSGAVQKVANKVDNAINLSTAGKVASAVIAPVTPLVAVPGALEQGAKGVKAITSSKLASNALEGSLSVAQPVFGLAKTAVNTKGGNVIGGAAKTYVKPGMEAGASIIGSASEGINGPLPELPSITSGGATQTPAESEADLKRKKIQAKRQEQINILTDRPGRGGTILTDQYTYKV